MWLRAPGGDQELSEQGASVVLPEGEVSDTDEAIFRRDCLLLLADIRDYNRRMCEVMERLFPKTDGPRYKQTGSWR